MKNIKVKNYKGNEFEGSWNEKIYSSKIDEQPDLIRIYINNQCIHVTKDEFERISDDAEKAKRIAKQRKIDDFFKFDVEDMNLSEKCRILNFILSDSDIIHLMSTENINTYDDLLKKSYEKSK